MSRPQKFPSNTISLSGPPLGRVMCDNDPCYGSKYWNVLAGEGPNCIMCAAAWRAAEDEAGITEHGMDCPCRVCREAGG